MDIVQNILNIANKNGFNNNQICKLLNKNASYVSDWKTGKSKPKADELIMLSEKFDCSVDELLGLKPSSSISTGDVNNSVVGSINSAVNIGSDLSDIEKELIKICRELDMKNQVKLLQFAYELEEE